MKKKTLIIISIILLVVMLFVLTGCSNNEANLSDFNDNIKNSTSLEENDYQDYEKIQMKSIL